MWCQPHYETVLHLCLPSELKGKMKRSKIPILMSVAAFLLLFPKLDSQLVARPPPMTDQPLCATQFALVNHACSLIPYTPLPPHPHIPSPSHHHRHKNHTHDTHSRRNHTHDHQETAAQHECCRWLTAVDVQCVCDLLVHLPVFLSRPLHNYTVHVDDNCRVTFECPGRVARV